MNHNPRQFMATQKRRYHPKKWAGVYVYETSEMYNGAPDLCFYITFKSGRRLIWEKVGKISEGYGPDVAAEIRAALSPAPETDADLIRSVYVSLAHSYGEAIRELERLTGQTWEKLYIAGGGAKNALLNELTAQYTGKEVVALPIEATALGNLKIQREIR